MKKAQLTIKPILEQEEEQETNVVDLKLLPGGKGPDNNYWLLSLEKGCIFLVKKKNEPLNYVRIKFTLISKSKEGTSYEIGDGSGQTIWVEPKGFSNQFELVEVILEGDDSE